MLHGPGYHLACDAERKTGALFRWGHTLQTLQEASRITHIHLTRIRLLALPIHMSVHLHLSSPNHMFVTLKSPSPTCVCTPRSPFLAVPSYHDPAI